MLDLLGLLQSPVKLRNKTVKIINRFVPRIAIETDSQTYRRTHCPDRLLLLTSSTQHRKWKHPHYLIWACGTKIKEATYSLNFVFPFLLLFVFVYFIFAMDFHWAVWKTHSLKLIAETPFAINFHTV